MTDKSKSVLRLAYHIAVTVALLAAGALLMVACVGIYRTAPDGHPFTREVVAQHFAPIALPVWVAVGVAVLGGILHPLLPDAPAPKADMTATVLRRLAARTDLTACPADLAAAVRKERRTRTLHTRIGLGLLLIGAAVFLWYALNVDHFHISEISPAIKAAMAWLIPCMGVPFAYGVFAAYHRRGSYLRELALLKAAPAEAVSPAPASAPMTERWVRVARYALLAVAVAALLIGWIGDGWMDVLTKAINICTECIGLG